MTAATGPRQVLIIRHGEKLGDDASDTDDEPHLSFRGAARATALPTLFAPTDPVAACHIANAGGGFAGHYARSGVSQQAPRFATPDFLFAARDSSNSTRPFGTVTPLAAALGVSCNHKHADKQYRRVARRLLGRAKYADKVVLICWHQGRIHRLAHALGVPHPPPWPGDAVYDRVWQITFADGAAVLLDLPQRLLYGDSAA